MRFSTEFLEFARQRLYMPGSPGDRILQGVVAHRRDYCLDDKFPPDDPWHYNDEALGYEFLKLTTIFEALRSIKSANDRLRMIAVLKEAYPADEVDQIVDEYFGSVAHQDDDKSKVHSARQ